MTPGESIKKAREAAGLSQDELGARLGKTGSLISQWENSRRNPSYKTVIKLANALGCRPEDVYGCGYITRADKWRSMTDEEIAMALYKNDKAADMFCKRDDCMDDDAHINPIQCFLCCLRWLKEEA